MQIDEIREYCLQKKGAYEDTPFGIDTITYKVMGKVFLFLPLDVDRAQCSIKGVPERWIELREMYDEIDVGPYLNKRHWSRVYTAEGVPTKLVKELIDTSYDLVVKGLTKKQQAELAGEE